MIEEIVTDIHLYVLAFAAAAALDSFPAFVPPSWVALCVLQARFGLNVWLAAAAGVAGSTAGRLILSLYVHRAAHVVLSRHEEHNIEYLGKSLGGKFREDFLFVFLYCLTPLSTAPLFLGAALAGVARRIVFPPFICGKLINYSLMLLAGQKAAPDIVGIIHGKLSWQAVLMALASFGMVGAMLFIDWRALLKEKEFRLDFNVRRYGRRRSFRTAGPKATRSRRRQVRL